MRRRRSADGISEQTFYRWKAKYGGMQASDAQKRKALEDARRWRRATD